MKPIQSVTTGLLLSVAIIFGLALAAAQFSSSEAVAQPKLDELPAESVVVAQAEENIVGLEIIITDIRNDKGKIIVAVFNRSGPYNAYDYEAARKYGEVEASTAVNGIIKLAMPTLDKGPYVVSLFHDENDNDDFDYDDDWPLEGYGTSNAKDAYHEPTFEEASVEPGRIFVKMYYLD